MCGIAGIVNLDGKMTHQLKPLQRMVMCMQRRGPDDEGYMIVDAEKGQVRALAGIGRRPVEACESFVALGHRRLSIIDLSSSARQPMATEDGRYWIVYNGEVYNYAEIRRELKAEGELFFSNSDAEVVLKAFRKWGPDCLRRFNGMWSFALWDNHEKTLFCARDRIGIKPFYYYTTDTLFLFASDIKTLIASGLYNPEPHWEGVYHAMSFHCAPRPMTCFKGVVALEQAHWMRLDLRSKPAHIQKVRYWQVPYGQIDYSKSEQQWLEELDEALTRSVKRRLIADVPVGTFMSGGIDSTTISAIAARAHPGIKAFTLFFDEEAGSFNELSQAQATSRMHPLYHIAQKVTLKNASRNLKEMVLCFEEPFCSLSPNYLIAQLASENKVKVVLNGLGGDELFCGYNRQERLGAWRTAQRWRHLIQALPASSRFTMKLRDYAQLKDIYDYYVYNVSIFTERHKKALFSQSAHSWSSFATFKSLYAPGGIEFDDYIDAMCYMDIINFIGNHHVYRLDQFSMNFSLECRLPFLDHELVELASRMPSHYKVRGGVGKYMLRKVARNLIHPSCLSMKKKGFELPLAYWMNPQLRALVSEKLAALGGRGIMAAAAVNQIKDDDRQITTNCRQLWFLVSLELWLEEMFKDNSDSKGYHENNLSSTPAALER